MKPTYRCPHCNLAIQPRRLIRMTGALSSLSIDFYCPCSEQPVTSQYRYNLPAIFAALGRDTMPALPYMPDPAPLTPAEIDRQVAAWAWEIEQCEDSDEFLLWLKWKNPRADVASPDESQPEPRSDPEGGAHVDESGGR